VNSLKLKVEGVAVNDPYLRTYGLGINQPLDRLFWQTQPHKVRNYVLGSFTDELDIPDTTSYVVVGVSAWVGYWKIKVYVNDKLIGEKNCAVPDAYQGSPGYPRFDIVTAPKAGAVAALPVLAPMVLGLALLVPSAYKFKR
jgi:hypothetical protein